MVVPTVAYGPGSFVGWSGFHLFNGWPGQRVLNGIGHRLRTKKRQMAGVKLMKQAFLSGVRLIDYSCTYKDEWILTTALRGTGIKREDIFITTRASNGDLYNDCVYESCLKSLETMGTDYIDIYGFHWPVQGHYLKAYQDLERLYKEGRIRAIGLCNCHQHHLEDIMEHCSVVPAINQFEVHPLFTQVPLVTFCQQNHIQVEAYTALARNDDRLRNEKILNVLSEKYHKSHGQIILKWHVQRGIIPVFRSASPKRIAGNLDLDSFELTPQEVEAISALNLDSRLRYDPDRSDLSRL